MKTATKKFTTWIIVTLAAFILCSMLALMTFNTFSVAAETPSLSSFITLDGASVRLTENSGIRFRNSISKTEYDALITEYGEENVKFGTVLAHKGVFSGELTLENCGAFVERTTWSKDNNPDLGTDTYVYNAVLVNLKEENYIKEYVVRGYVTITTAEQTTTYYSAPETVGGNVRSPLYVATAAVQAEEPNEFLDKIIYKSIETCSDSDLTVTLSKSALKKDETAEISATLNGIAVNPVFSVEDNGVLTVSNGVITAIGGGSATVTATLSATYGVNTKTLTATASVLVAFEASADQDVVTVSEELTDAKVMYNSEEIGRFTGKTFNAVEMLSKAGKIAVGAQSYTLTVEAADGRSAEVTVTYIGLNNENFATTINASNSATYSSTYYVLTEDITTLGETTPKLWNVPYVYDSFYGILDGQGYKITKTADYTTTVGLFTQLWGTFKNLQIDITVGLNHGANKGAFIGAAQSGAKIENCFVKVDYNNNVTGNTAVIFQMGNTTITNCIFDVSGGANVALFGSGCGGTNYITDCILLRESSSQPFALTTTVSANRVFKGCYVYASSADFIGGVNGYAVEDGTYGQNAEIAVGTDPVGTAETPVTKYSTFTGVWAIDAVNGTITLCGKTAYEPVAVTLSADKDIVTVSEELTNAQVKYNGEVIGTFTGTTFNAVEMLSKAGKIAAGEQSYTLTVKAAGYTVEGDGVSVTYTGLNNTNFAEKIIANTSSKNANEYFVLTEDITELGETTPKLWNVPYVYDSFYGILDGQGYKITKTADYTTTVGLFTQLWGTFKNLQIDITVGLNHGANKGAFVGATQAGSKIENCFVKVDYNSNVTGNTAVIFQMGTTAITNCIFDVSGGTNVALFGSGCSGTNYITDCILIRESSLQPFALTSAGGNRVFKGCYVYASSADFIGGVNGYAVEDGTYGAGAEITVGTDPVGTAETPVTKYSTFTGVWAIDAVSGTITLCGKTAYSAA